MHIFFVLYNIHYKCHGKQFTCSSDKDLTEQHLEEEINEQEVMEEALSVTTKS